MPEAGIPLLCLPGTSPPPQRTQRESECQARPSLTPPCSPNASSSPAAVPSSPTPQCHLPPFDSCSHPPRTTPPPSQGQDPGLRGLPRAGGGSPARSGDSPEPLTSSSLWLRIPRTRSCRFLSNMRSMLPFTIFSAMAGPGRAAGPALGAQPGRGAAAAAAAATARGGWNQRARAAHIPGSEGGAAAVPGAAQGGQGRPRRPRLRSAPSADKMAAGQLRARPRPRPPGPALSTRLRPHLPDHARPA